MFLMTLFDMDAILCAEILKGKKMYENQDT